MSETEEQFRRGERVVFVCDHGTEQARGTVIRRVPRAFCDCGHPAYWFRVDPGCAWPPGPITICTRNVRRLS
jgi:hypothetical protein